MRLVSFALHWIKAEIHEYILRNWRLVKVATTKAQRKLFFNLRSMKATLGGADARPRRSAIATDAGREARGSGRDGNAPRPGSDIALDPQPDDDGDAYRADRLPDRHRGRAGADPRARGRPATNRTEGPAHARSRSSTTAAAASSRRAGCARTDPATLQDLADEYGVSAERIRQIESKAMKTMRSQMGALA